MACPGNVCRIVHLRSVLASGLAALVFSLLILCYNLISTGPQQSRVRHAEMDSNLIISDQVPQRLTANKLYAILNNDSEDVPVEDRIRAETSDVHAKRDFLHQCRVKVILDEVGRVDQQYQDVISQCSRVIYNRVPKCGSRTVLGTFKALSSELNYSLVAVEKPARGRSYFSENDLPTFVENFTEFESPLLYSQHLHYVDFTKFHHENPLYINVIREPTERQISHFYYNQFGSSNQPKNASKESLESIDECVESGTGFCINLNAMLPFFCGQEKMCRTRSEAVLKKAKRIVSENVLVIGFTEDLPSFMEVLEFILPNYFANATDIFRDISIRSYNKTKTAVKPSVKPETRRKLREHLSLEYDFYNFAKQRFYKLLQRVRRAKVDLNYTPLYRNKRNFFHWWNKSEKLPS